MGENDIDELNKYLHSESYEESQMSKPSEQEDGVPSASESPAEPVTHVHGKPGGEVASAVRH